jgi:hypothetical protein
MCNAAQELVNVPGCPFLACICLPPILQTTRLWKVVMRFLFPVLRSSLFWVRVMVTSRSPLILPNTLAPMVDAFPDVVGVDFLFLCLFLLQHHELCRPVSYLYGYSRFLTYTMYM